MGRITRIEAVGLVEPLAEDRRYGNARGLAPARAATLIRLDAGGGIEGVGEAWGPPALAIACVDAVRSFAIGRSLWEWPHIWAEIFNRLYHFGHQGVLTATLSGLDIALHDALGKELGVPVADLLGGRVRDRIPAYASTGYFTPGDVDASLKAWLEASAGQGYPGFKIKLGRSPADDEWRVRAAREIIGPDALLMVDANGNYTADVALESMRRIAPYDIHWYEEPLPPHDFAGYARLVRDAPMPVATGEALYTAKDFQRLIDAKGADILQPDLTMMGGLAEGRLVARLGELANLRVAPHVWGGAVGLAAALHFLAALPASPHTTNPPYPTLLEHDRGPAAIREDMLTAPLVATDGHLPVPDGPGLGIEVDWGKVERLRLG